jgi:hypothetical protein
MPLVQGFTQASINENIAQLVRDGKTPAQSSAIAFRIARKAWRREHPGDPLPGHLKRRRRNNPLRTRMFRSRM